MNRILAFLFGLREARNRDTFHNDRLRANQPNEPYYTFSYWRALVS